MKKLISVFILNLIFLSSCYAARIDGPYEGRVIDAETKQPVEGVVILGTWSREHISPGGATHTFYDAQETVTDKNGDFEIKGLGLLVMSNVIPMDILIFKAGYTYFGVMSWSELKSTVKVENNRTIIRLKKLTREERKKNLPPLPPGEAPYKKIKSMLDEYNKNSKELGLGIIDVWRDTR